MDAHFQIQFFIFNNSGFSHFISSMTAFLYICSPFRRKRCHVFHHQIIRNNGFLRYLALKISINQYSKTTLIKKSRKRLNHSSYSLFCIILQQIFFTSSPSSFINFMRKYDHPSFVNGSLLCDLRVICSL